MESQLRTSWKHVSGPPDANTNLYQISVSLCQENSIWDVRQMQLVTFLVCSKYSYNHLCTLCVIYSLMVSQMKNPLSIEHSHKINWNAVETKSQVWYQFRRGGRNSALRRGGQKRQQMSSLCVLESKITWIKAVLLNRKYYSNMYPYIYIYWGVTLVFLIALKMNPV